MLLRYRMLRVVASEVILNSVLCMLFESLHLIVLQFVVHNISPPQRKYNRPAVAELSYFKC